MVGLSYQGNPTLRLQTTNTVMHVRLRHLAPFLACIAAYTCKDTGYPPLDTGEWAMYRLEDTTMTSDKVRNEPLQNLSLQPTPFLTSRDLRSYHWATHAMEVTPRLDTLFDRLTYSQGSVFGRPFVVAVGAERIYLGSFWWAYSSVMPRYPYLEMISPKPRRIELPPLHTGNDPRRDERIHWSLKKAGVLVE